MTRVTLPAAGETERDALASGRSERWFRTAPAMMHSIDGRGRLIAVSDIWLAKLGYERDEVIGRPSADFLTAESRRRAIDEVLPAFFRSGHCENVEYQMVGKDGRIIDVLLSGLLDEDQTVGGRVSLSIITDVTERNLVQRKLAESEARYRELVEDQSELVSLATPDGVLRYVNHAYARHYGAQADELVGKNILDFVPEDTHAALVEHLRRVRAAEGSIAGENRVLLASGETRWMSWTNRALRDHEGNVTAIHSVGRDIEQRVVAERRLKESEARYRLLAEHSTDMVLEVSLDFTRLYVSPACRELLGFEPEELIGEKSGALAHPEDAESVAKVMQNLVSGRVDRATVEARHRHRDGRWIWAESRCRALKDSATGATIGIVASVRDISARKVVEEQLAEAYRRLEALAREDGLTGLANRRTFDDALEREFARAWREERSLGLIMLDIDGFKQFNDRYGHPAGDECLRRIARTLSSVVSRPGCLAARYGGEEFALLLADTDEFGAAMIGERLREAVLRLGVRHDASPHGVITISAGVAAFGRRILDRPEDLVQAADIALYRAKNAGRNVVMRATSPQAPRAMPSTAA
jgi:diguanylate cyclase (GGDEF)-like protein/PAS domain S-box-containing protein